MNARNGFLLALAGTFVLKLVLAGAVDLSGDEAYYYVYGMHPALGYKDHPPMVGWMVRLFLYFGRSELVLRLPAVLFSTVVGAGIYLVLRRFDEEKAALVATVYLLSPLNLLNVLVTTDTPLYLFTFLSAAALYKALDGDRPGYFCLSGALLGCAFLSKYFAVLVGIAYVAYALLHAKEPARRKGFALLFLSVLPFAALNVHYNYTHCWDNILFNLFNRNVGETFTPKKILVNLATQAYLVTPPVLYFLAKARKGMAARVSGHRLAFFAFLFLVPAAFFAALSAVKTIGLHWALSFYPFLYLALFLALGTEETRKCARSMAVFSAVHLVLLGVLLAVPLRMWKDASFYRDIVFMFKGKEIASQLLKYAPAYRLSTLSYSQSATLAYHAKEYVFVFGAGSRNGRQDDILTDFRTLDNRDILVFMKDGDPYGDCVPYFRAVEPARITAGGEVFHVALGRGFRYEAYRDGVLRKVADTYFNVPSFLPHAPCYFRERYFKGEACCGEQAPRTRKGGL